MIQAPLDLDAWGNGSETANIAVGAWYLIAAQAGVWEAQHLRFAVGARGIRAARWLLVVALPFIGREVIVDAFKYGDKVMQPWLQWLPHPVAWACLTGIGSFAACLALLFGM